MYDMSMQPVPLHGSSNGSVVHNCQAQGTLKLVQYVWIVGTSKYMVLC